VVHLGSPSSDSEYLFGDKTMVRGPGVEYAKKSGMRLYGGLAMVPLIIILLDKYVTSIFW
jgi:hypothetical protein